VFSKLIFIKNVILYNNNICNKCITYKANNDNFVILLMMISKLIIFLTDTILYKIIILNHILYINLTLNNYFFELICILLNNMRNV